MGKKKRTTLKWGKENRISLPKGEMGEGARARTLDEREIWTEEDRCIHQRKRKAGAEEFLRKNPFKRQGEGLRSNFPEDPKGPNSCFVDKRGIGAEKGKTVD